MGLSVDELSAAKELAVSAEVWGAVISGAGYEKNSAGLGMQMAAQWSSTAAGGAGESSDNMYTSSFSIGGLLRMAKRAAGGAK
jgi:hypothetical protein